MRGRWRPDARPGPGDRVQDLGVRRGLGRRSCRRGTGHRPGWPSTGPTTDWSARRARARPATGRTWYIDPVDGTYNFLSGIPYWCSALSGWSTSEGPLVGAVYYPVLDQLWLGGRDRPTTLDGVPVPPAGRPAAGPGLGGHLLPPPAHGRPGPAGGLAGGDRGRRDRTDARLGVDRPGPGGQRPARHLPAGQPAPLGLVSRRRAGDRRRRSGRASSRRAATSGRSPATARRSRTPRPPSPRPSPTAPPRPFAKLPTDCSFRRRTAQSVGSFREVRRQRPPGPRRRPRSGRRAGTASNAWPAAPASYAPSRARVCRVATTIDSASTRK